MKNPFYNVLSNQMPTNNMINQLMQFKQSFRGNAREQVQQMLNSGQITQEQFNRASQMVNQLMNIMR